MAASGGSAAPRARGEAWLFTVARHLAIDDRRGARMRHQAGADPLPEIPAADQIDRVLDGWLVAVDLAGLSAEHREVILPSYYQGDDS